MDSRLSSPKQERITAGLLIIGDEILSGRTKDQNIGYIAAHLTAIGIDLLEVRIVPDVQRNIIEAVNAMRSMYTYLLTTGGIGPTHDDITADAIAKAFGVSIGVDERAVKMMRERYKPEELTEARLRMARIPEGADLVDNPISRTPGFWLDNVIVMAGIPRVMQVMLDAVTPKLKVGRILQSVTVRVDQPEGDVAPGLERVQNAYPDVSMGSYPFFKDGRLGTHLVLRSVDAARLGDAAEALAKMLREEGLTAE